MGDVIAYALVITPGAQQLFAFTVPVQTDVKQVIVTGPNFGPASSLADLGGKQVYVNPLTVNYQNLQRVNQTLQKEGKTLIDIKAADKNLLEDDLVQRWSMLACFPELCYRYQSQTLVAGFTAP